MKKNIHHSTPIARLGNCLICGNFIMQHWEDAEETNGHSDTYTEKRTGTVHYKCNGGKSLSQINQERARI